MSVSSQAIANKFFELAKSEGKLLTNMQLQKLVYISQGFSLALLDKTIYFHNSHAWQFGPVIPKLYKSLQKYGNGHVTEQLLAEDKLPNESQEIKIVKGVWQGYGHFSGGQLSALTHKPGTPWSQTWESNQFGIIPRELMSEYYKRLLETS